MIRTKSGAAVLSIVSNSRVDRAQDRRGGDHRLDRDHHRGGALVDRPGRLGGRVGLGAKGDEPPDREHPYGHEKAENLAAAIEGMLILIGAGIIVFEATRRLVVGAEVENLGVGMAVIAFSAVANLAGSTTSGVAREHRSAALEGDAAHCAPTR